MYFILSDFIILHLVNGVLFSIFLSFCACCKKVNLFHYVVEHKDIKKAVDALKTVISSQKTLVADALKEFGPFQKIWNADKNLIVKVCFPSYLSRP